MTKLPKYKSVSMGGGSSYLFSLPALPLSFAYNETFSVDDFFHLILLEKSVDFLNPPFLYKSSSLNFLTELSLIEPPLLTIITFYHFCIDNMKSV